jgi:hypothetical protein
MALRGVRAFSSPRDEHAHAPPTNRSAGRPVRPWTARFAWRADTFGIDSEHDYDPVWAKCRELGVVASIHGPGEGSTFHDSISNTVYNHAGHFAAAATGICKSLFLGGVSQRFPELRFLFLEGGVGWARSLLADLTSHGEKRNLAALARDSDPRLADVDLFLDLAERFGGTLRRATTRADLATRWDVHPEDPTDSFGAREISTRDELRDLFVDRFYWDVPLMEDLLEEVYEPSEHGLMDEADLRDFVITNPVRLWTSTNPDFFRGTAVDQAAAAVIGNQGSGHAP